MKLLGFIICAMLSTCLHAEIYKWIDKNGVTHYGQKAPPNTRATVVDTEPYGIGTDEKKECHTVQCQAQRAEAAKQRELTKQKKDISQEANASEPASVSTESSSVRGMDFEVYIRLHPGMTEGELLVRAGKPDREVVEGSEETVARKRFNARGVHRRSGVTVRDTTEFESAKTEVVKTYYYLPTLSNPYTTVVTLRGGRITDIQRIKKY